ncbi:hypothetical protein IPM44_02645 [bacterium]|nr:MAG: hypothetical protein IPM44_02645 [bacterium]
MSDREDSSSDKPNPGAQMPQHVVDAEFTAIKSRFRMSLGQKIDHWQWQRFIDGDYSALRDAYDAYISFPIAVIAVGVVLVGGYLSPVLPQLNMNHIILTVWLIGLIIAWPLRFVVFYTIRTKVRHFAEAQISDAWILNEDGLLEEVIIIEDPTDEE